MNELAKQYLAGRTKAWAPSTLRSESSRLTQLIIHLDGDPDTLWTALLRSKPYTRTTSWTRVSEFWQWLINNGHRGGANVYAEWRNQNAQNFKNAYTHKPAHLTLEEAKGRIACIPDQQLQDHALLLLLTGLRKSEPQTYDGQRVVGKGGKSRPVWIPTDCLAAMGTAVSYSRLWNALKKVGLTPHSLRKIFLSELARSGANPFELCQIAGWSSPATAMSYIQGVRSDELVKALQARSSVTEPKERALLVQISESVPVGRGRSRT